VAEGARQVASRSVLFTDLVGSTELRALDLATVLLRRDADGDRERATQLLVIARAAAEHVGAPGVVARIEAVTS
jgi:hypothetical protein